ncbi:hypothetical protein DFJ74DRAFT_657665 [Hyaloraphidium curvatum]|nr:hypothetical protein DFJ74DRAFT_657665 [Hyaloraphidium curvatum]
MASRVSNLLARPLARLACRTFSADAAAASACRARSAAPFAHGDRAAAPCSSNGTLWRRRAYSTASVESDGEDADDAQPGRGRKRYMAAKRAEPRSEVEEVVRGIVAKHVSFPDGKMGDDWMQFEFLDLSVKFKIVSESMDHYGRRIHSVDLTNMITVEDLVEHLAEDEPHDPLYGEDTVERMFREEGSRIPPNMYWVSKDRRERVVGSGSFATSGEAK